MSVTPDVALRDYEMYRVRRVSLRTWSGEKPGLLNLVDWLLYHDLAMDQITQEHLDEWWYGLHLADSTKHTRLSQVRSFFTYCQRVRKWVVDDPSLTLTAPKPMPEPRERLDAAELLALLDTAAWPQHRIILALAMNCGLRAGEIKRLRIADWWGDRLRVRVDKTREVDDMPVTAELRAELTEWMRHYSHECPGLRRSHPLVPSQYVSNINRRVTYRPDRGSIGDPEDVVKAGLATLGWEVVTGEGIHTVRRSIARVFYDAAVAENGDNDALLATMRLLHHSKPTTTLLYIGVDKQTEERDALLCGRSFLPRLAAGVTALPLAQ